LLLVVNFRFLEYIVSGAGTFTWRNEETVIGDIVTKIIALKKKKSSTSEGDH